MNPLARTRRRTPGLLALALAAVGGLLFACGRSEAQPGDAGDTKTVRGTVKSLTTAPMGEVDGAKLDDGTWLHWPPHLEDRFTDVVKKGDEVRATGRTETGPAGDTHFEVRSVTNVRSKATAENPDYANGPPPPPRGRRGEKPAPPPPPDPDRRGARAGRDAGETKTVRGTVKSFTTAPRGEVDGAVLDDGTALHWPPHMQDRFTDVVKKGDRVRAAGRTETGPDGDTHFEVQSVTNLRADSTAENPDFANGPPPPPGRRGRGEKPAPPPPPDRRGVGPGRVADREQRLQDLENQLDQLRREIDRLRRER